MSNLKSETTRRRGRKKPDLTSPADQLNLLQKLVERVEAQVNSGEVKASIADVLRLIQFLREYSEERVKEIEVRWVDGEKKDESE